MAKKPIANCFQTLSSVGVFAGLEVCTLLKCKYPAEEMTCESCYQSFIPWCREGTVSSPDSSFDVIVESREGKRGLWAAKICEGMLLTWADSGQWEPGCQPGPSLLHEVGCPVLTEFCRNIKCKIHLFFFVGHFSSVSSLFLLASGRFMVWKIKVWIYFHYQRICKTELGLSELTFAFAIP